MHITIEINTNEANADDLRVLAAIGAASGSVEAPSSPAPAAKAAAPAKAPAKAAPAPKPEPEPEPEEDLVGDDAPTLDQAKALATKLVAEGKAKEVKSQLEAIGVKRVSELDSDGVAAFISALS